MDCTVVCVYKTGGDFTPKYVQMLRDGCLVNGADKFICLTDDEEVSELCEVVPLKLGLPGWWSKLELFNLPPNQKYVYFDLDTVINGNLDPLLSYDHKFTTLSGLSGTGKIASGVMAWRGDYSYLVSEFDESVIPDYTPPTGKMGDQEYINDNIKCDVEFIQDILPDFVSSRKYNHVQYRRKSNVICYHGNPRPHKTGWAI